MKRIFVLIFALMCADAVMAQEGYSIGDGFIPPKPTFLMNNTSQGESNIRNTNQSDAPIAPATLLLLGLGGASVGVTVIRNTKKGGE